MTLVHELTKVCGECGEAKPLDAFYAGRATCKGCYNARTKNPTPTRVNRNRARHRAIADLIARHEDEFTALLEQRLVEASAEAEQLASTPAAVEHYSDDVVRLRPGPRMPGEKAGDRIDVARCPHCIKHHDRGHVCPKCGTAPASALRLKDDGELDEIAIERAMAGDPVRLTKSERDQVVRLLLARGASNSAIAERLHCDQKSVERWRSQISAPTTEAAAGSTA